MAEQFSLSQRRACGLIAVSRTVMNYMPRPNELNERLRQRLRVLAEKHRRWGHIRLYVLLRREGYVVNHKRTERLYRDEGLALRIRRRKKFAAVVRQPLPEAVRPNERWAMDFIQDSLWSGQKFRTLSIVDMFTRECLAVEADTSIPSQRAVMILERIAARKGLPESIRVDNGPEFISKALGGNPISGLLTITIALYDASTGGNMVWSRQYVNVNAVNGYVGLVLEGGTPDFGSLSSSVFNQPLWVETTVGSATLGTIVSPRQRLCGTPFAMTVPDGAVTTMKIADSAVTLSKLAGNAVGTSNLADSSVTTSKMAPGAVTKIIRVQPADAMMVAAGGMTLCSQAIQADYAGNVKIFFKGFIDAENTQSVVDQQLYLGLDSVQIDFTRSGISASTTRLRNTYSLLYAGSLSAGTHTVLIWSQPGGGQSVFPTSHRSMVLVVEMSYK